MDCSLASKHSALSGKELTDPITARLLFLQDGTYHKRTQE